MKSFASDPGPAPLAAKAAAIDVMFGHDTVEQCLEAARSSGDDWAVKVATEMGAKSPTSLKVTLAALRHARTLGSLEDCLNMEFRIISRMFHATGLPRRRPRGADRQGPVAALAAGIPFRSVGSRRLRPLRPARPQGTGPHSSVDQHRKANEETTMSVVGFIGLGNMGGPMAANLSKAGHDVEGFDVSAAAIEAAGKAGISVRRLRRRRG